MYMKKAIKRGLFILIAAALLLTAAGAIYSHYIFKGISENIVRLHVIANSDSAEDQALKLKVRDRILEAAGDLFDHCENAQESLALIKENTALLEEAARACLAEENSSYAVAVKTGTYYFPTRHYGSVSLPAGEYQAVRVEIGEAAGQNWWCVLFPPLCFVNASVPELPAGADAKPDENRISEENTDMLNNHRLQGILPEASFDVINHQKDQTVSEKEDGAQTEASSSGQKAQDGGGVKVRFKIVDFFQQAKHTLMQAWDKIF